MKTTSLGLKKPDSTDHADIQDLNDNMDIINKELLRRPTDAGDASEMTVAFTEATQLTELTSNDSLSGLLGKLKLAVKNVIAILKLLNSLTADGRIKEVKIVAELPADAANHPNTFYWITG